MNAEQLKASILQMAIEGKLVPQSVDDETVNIDPKDVIPEEEQPFDIPDSWRWVYLGKFFLMKAGKYISANEISSSGKYPCFGGNGVRGFVERNNHFGKFPIIGRQGALCGNINIADGKFYATEHAVVVHCPKNTDPDCIALFLKALNLNQYATKTAQPGLAVSRISSVPFPLPPLAEQKRIVEKLEQILPLIEAYGEAQQNLESINKVLPNQIKQSILQAAVQGKLVPQSLDDETVDIDHKDVIPVEEQPFDVPNSWKWTKLGTVVDVRDGTHDTPKYVDAGVPLITSKNLRNGKLDFTNVKYISEKDHKEISKRSKVDIGDILLAMIGTIGNPTKILDNRQEFSIKNIALFKPNKNSIVDFDYLLIFLRWAQKLMNEKASGGVQQFVSLKFLRSYPIPLPPLAEQMRIVEKIEELFKLIEAIK